MKAISTSINNFISRVILGKRLYYFSRDYYYEELLDKYSDGLFYKNLKDRLALLAGRKSTVEIRVLDGKTPNNIIRKEVVKKYGRPNYKIKNEAFPDITILFYKRQIGEYKVKLEFHFYKKDLVFFSYNFPYLSPESYEEVVQIIRDKYLGDGSQDIMDSYIIDRNGNIVLPDNIFGFSVYYFCPDNQNFSNMLRYIDSFKEKNDLKGEINRKVLYNRL